MDSPPLTIDGVWKGYPRGAQWTEVLANVTLKVERGEVVAVTGARLEGKTTLLTIAAGMERPDKGNVSLCGHVSTDCRDGERSRMLGHEVVWLDRDGPGLNVEVSRFVGFPLALHGRGRRQAGREAARMLERVGARKCQGRCWGDSQVRSGYS